jgi:hypothetical protein
VHRAGSLLVALGDSRTERRGHSSRASTPHCNTIAGPAQRCIATVNQKTHILIYVQHNEALCEDGIMQRLARRSSGTVSIIDRAYRASIAFTPGHLPIYCNWQYQVIRVISRRARELESNMRRV